MKKKRKIPVSKIFVYIGRNWIRVFVSGFIHDSKQFSVSRRFDRSQRDLDTYRIMF